MRPRTNEQEIVLPTDDVKRGEPKLRRFLIQTLKAYIHIRNMPFNLPCIHGRVCCQWYINAIQNGLLKTTLEFFDNRCRYSAMCAVHIPNHGAGSQWSSRLHG